MSGVLKGIGKVFKKIVKVVKKVALPALAIGAIVLTGGAAIGALPALGTMLGGLGLSAGVTAALTTAVSSAAIGGAVGGLSAAASGKNILKGMGTGAGVGFVTGGVAGATGLLGTAASGATGAASTGAAATGAAALPGAAVGGAGSAAVGSAATAATGAATGGVVSGIAKAGSGLLSSLTNPMVLGPVLQGIGGGISSSNAAKEESKARIAERAAISNNYGLLGTADGYVSDGTNRPTPTQRFDPRAYGGSYQYDAAQGRVVFVPNAAAGA